MVQAQIICTKSSSRGSVVERPAASRTITKKDLDGGDFRAKKGGAGAEWCCRICKRPLHVIVYDPNARPEFAT
jgi:hypothetical protein